MAWILLTLVSAFSVATSDAFRKNALRVYSEYLVAWAVLTVAAVLLLALLFVTPLPNLDADFYVAFGCALPLEIAAVILYTKALKVSPLGLTVPFLSLTPAFLLVTPFLILGETIKAPGIIGILVLACGAYLLNISRFKDGIFEPFHAVRREKGSLYMIGVAAIYSLTSTLGKRGIEHSSPVFFMATYVAAQSLVLAVPALLSWRRHDPVLRPLKLRHLMQLTFLPGVLLGISLATHSWAIQMTQVAYMISVKRLSLLIGVLYGWLFFKEKEIRERLLGAALMLAGFIIIVLFGR